MFSTRAAIVLCVLTLLLAASTCWAVSDASMLPAFWLPDSALAAQFVAGFALALAAFGAPHVFSREELSGDAPRLALAKTAAAALWFGIAAAFMLLVASRISPVGGAGVIQAALWAAFLFWLAAALARNAPRLSQALLFFWIVALPVGAYMLKELFMSSPGGSGGVAHSRAPQAAALSSAIHWILNLSPGTAALGALSGTLADESAYSVWGAALCKIAVGILVCAYTVKPQKPHTTAA